LQNIHIIIDLSTLIVYYYDNKLMFIIQIPLIKPVKFNLYKSLPLPTPRDHLTYYVLIHPSKPYVAITDDRLTYTLLDSISDCKLVNKDYILCPTTSILSTISNPTCESKLITEATLSLPEICDSKIIYGNTNIWQKLNDDKYIYVQTKANRLTLKCENNVTDYVLQGTGILSLKNNCVAYFETLQFYPSIKFKLILPNQINLNFDLTLDNCCKYDLINISSHSLNPISLSHVDLESLKLASHKLDNLENEILTSQSQPHILKYGNYYSGLTYFIISLIFIYLAYKIYKRCFCNNNSTCCIQIFNQCYNTRRHVRENNVKTSIELTEISDDLEDDRKSVKSLPNIGTDRNYINLRRSHESNRNLSNF